MNSEDILAKIKRYCGLGKLSVFVGAGVSKLSGFPSWNSLVQGMADDVMYTYKKNADGYAIFTSEELLKIPQMYFLKFGEDMYQSKVQKGFGNNCSPNRVHDLILSLHPNHIMTTNYDTLLEDTATKFGRNFSIINSNQVVSQAETANYIVKVHGDFSAKYVLKEQDYLDYENDYILIDNVVKTIFATNLVLFIGYGLNDYNIKLILNWVKRVQSTSYIQPVFIHTGDALTEIERMYQNGRGLEILDCNDYTDEVDYSEKYSSVLKQILQFNVTHDLYDIPRKLKYVYDRVFGIKNLNYVRREDFDKIFIGDYKLDDNWCIENISVTRDVIVDENGNLIPKDEYRVNYFEDFFTHEESYQLSNVVEYDVLKQFLVNAGVNGIKGQSRLIIPNISISSLGFLNRYEDMEKFCASKYSCISENYKKAYYLTQLGEYDQSYIIYTEIVQQAKKQEQWDIYFFSQINRQYLFAIITQRIAQSTGFQGTLNFGKNLEIFNRQFVEQLNYEMSGNSLESQFSDLPYEFKCLYPSLKDFSKRNSYINKYYDLVKEKYEVEKSLQKDTTYFGMSKFDKIKISMLETSKFIYDNMILFDGFDENKLYIKNSLISWLEAFQKEITKNPYGPMGFISNTRCKFTLVDLILISKSFKDDDIYYLSNKLDLSKIPFDEVKELEAYIETQICNYKRLFDETLNGGKIFLWKLYSEEIRNLLFISSYFIANDECILTSVQFIINMADGHYVVDDRIKLISRYLRISNSREVNQIIEKWLVEKIEKVLEKKIPNVQIHNAVIDIAVIARLCSTLSSFKADIVSEIIVEHKDDILCLNGCFDQLLLIVNDTAKSVIESMYHIENVFQIMTLGSQNSLPSHCDEISIVKEYFEKILVEREKNKEAGIVKYTLPGEDEHIGQVAAYMLTRKFPQDFVDKYCYICAEYTFLLCPLRFVEENFRIDWLFTYSDHLCERLQKCDVQKVIIINAIEKSFDGKIESPAQLRRLFAIYQIMKE